MGGDIGFQQFASLKLWSFYLEKDYYAPETLSTNYLGDSQNWYYILVLSKENRSDN